MLPLTHRDWSSAVSFVAGQCKGLSEQDWSGLAGKGRTLVIYMGVATAAAIADKLMADGVAPDMPVAVLERGTLEGHRALRTLLADLGPMVEREKVKSPAMHRRRRGRPARRRRGQARALGEDGGGFRMKILTGNDLPTGDVDLVDRHRLVAPCRGCRRRRRAWRSDRKPRRARAPRQRGLRHRRDRDPGRPPPRPHQGPRSRAGPDRAPRPDLEARRSERRELGDLMYRYDKYDQAIVDARVEEFRDQAARRLAGAADRGPVQAAAAEERALPPAPRLHAARRHPLRHARQPPDAHARRTSRASTTAATAISPRARTSSTTGSSSSRPPDILADLATVEMHAIQTSGESIRNVSSDQYAGAAADEIADPRPWAELIRQCDDLPSRVQLPAAQVQDRGDRGARRTAPRSGCTTSA